MGIITGNEHDLRQLINGVYQRIDRCDDNVLRYALIDYLYQLHGVERAMTGRDSNLDEVRCFITNSRYRKYQKYIDSLFRRLEDEFIEFREYHQDHFDAMLDINDNELDELADVKFSDGYQTISEEEFCEYFFEFLQHYCLENFFDKFITGRKIFNRPLNENEKYCGTMLHDPGKRKSSIVLCDFEYIISYLLVLGHEFGHAFDISELDKNDVHGYMKYSYSSVYGETIAMMFEKLFYDFLFKKRYRIDELKENYSDFVFEGKNYVLDAFLVSLLDNKTIRGLSFDSIGHGQIVEEVRDNFTRIDELYDHLDGRRLDTWKVPLYAYGDYLSTILKESVQYEGFDCRLMRDFLDIRKKGFDPCELDYVGFDMDSYQKIYRKDISRLKK